MARLDSLVEPSVGFEQLRALIEMDLSGYPLDGPVPDVPETELGTKTRQKHFLGIARRNNLTVRQLMAVAARAGAIAGGPESIADHIEEWVRSDAADGFNITFADSADSLDVFVDHVIPELQRRGIFHTEYRGSTLRENLGLSYPVNRFVSAARRRSRARRATGARSD